jgi:general secretion pathway protein C
VLSGIFAGSREADSRALIAPQGGEEKPFAIGADVVRGVTLHAIFPDRVVLSRQGNLETLRLDKNAPSSGLVPLAGGTPGAQNIAVPALAAVREQILQDPAKAAEFIRIQPLSENGSLKGYRIYPGRDRSIFNSAGLRPGDLVTAVNGIELNDAQNALQMLNDLSQAGSVSLVIERGGQSQTLNVSLN